MKNNIKLVLTDIDGVWTDGGMYYDELGNELKRFNTSDSVGVLLCKFKKIPIGIITGENTEIVKRRADKLKIDYLFQGVSNKLATALSICQELGISIAEVAYIGDDIGDLQLLRNVGFSGAPKNSHPFILQNVTHITQSSGGAGAFREFVETILDQEVVVSFYSQFLE